MHRQNGVYEYTFLFNKTVALIERQVVEKYRLCITFFIFCRYFTRKVREEIKTIQ